MPSKRAPTARKRAHAWFGEQSDLPKGSMLQIGAYDPEIRGRLFTVNYFARSLQQQLCLIEFYVLDDGTVAIKSDQRSSADEAGKFTESRFFEAMGLRTSQTPQWFQNVERASWFFDKRGIDAFAFVDYKKGERRLRVPIQLKSSRGGAKAYAEKHPLCNAHGVVVIIVNPKKTDSQLREYVYGQLGAVRRQKIKDGTRFTELHRLLGSGHK